MADKALSALTTTSSLTGTDLFYVLDGANSRAVSYTNLLSNLGTVYQPLDSTLTSFSSLGTAADKLAYTTGTDTWAETALTSAARSLLDDASVSDMRTTLGLAIGSDVQAYSSVLGSTTASFTTALETKLSGIETSATADQTGAEIKTLYEAEADTNAFDDAAVTKLSGIEANADVTDTANVTAAGAVMDSEVDANIKTLTLPASTTITAAGAALVDDASASAQRTTLGLAIGTDVQAYDAELAALAGLTSAANKVPYFTGSGTAGLLDFVDEDTMSSDSATAVPSQQSVKAYVDASGGGGGGAIYSSAGNFYAVGAHSSVCAGLMGGGVNAPNPITVDRLYMCPFEVKADHTVTDLTVYVGTAAASSLIRVGIYNNDSTGKPTTLVLDAGTYSGATTGFKSKTISQALDAGVYWFAYVVDTTGLSVMLQDNDLIGYWTDSWNYHKHYYRSFTFAALPADESSSTWTRGTGQSPQVMWK